MNKNPSLSLAYYLVTTGFTIGLLGLILFMLELVLNAEPGIDMPIHIVKNQQKISLIKYGNDVLWDSEKDSSGIVQTNYDAKSIINLPVHYLRKSDKGLYIFFVFRYLLEYLVWMSIGYQVFLILFDAKRKEVFTSANISRLRKTASRFLLLSLLFILSFDFRGYLDQESELYISSSFSVRMPGTGITYLLVATLVFVLASFIQEAKQLKEEGELTI